MEVDVFLWAKSALNLIHLLVAILAGKRVSEGKVCCFLRSIGEQVVELQNELVVFVDEELALRRDSAPLLLLVRHDFEDRSQPLRIKLGLFEMVLRAAWPMVVLPSC